jgi:hypothetical protein
LSVLKYYVTFCSLNDILVVEHLLYRVFVLLLDRKTLVQCPVRSFANISSHATSRGGLTFDEGRWTEKKAIIIVIIIINFMFDFPCIIS